MTEVYQLPDLPYDPSDLEPHLNARIVELHHGKHHAAYVAGANKALERLAQARSTNDFALITMLEKDLAFNVSGHVLHSVYWTNLSPEGGGEPADELRRAIDGTFGGFDAFRSQLAAAAKAVQGSGWALASWDPFGGRIVVQQVYDHQGNHGQGTVPLLAIDVWEHAYYLQYENRRPDYVDAIWNLIDWSNVAARFGEARGHAADI